MYHIVIINLLILLRLRLIIVGRSTTEKGFSTYVMIKTSKQPEHRHNVTENLPYNLWLNWNMSGRKLSKGDRGGRAGSNKRSASCNKRKNYEGDEANKAKRTSKDPSHRKVQRKLKLLYRKKIRIKMKVYLQNLQMFQHPTQKLGVPQKIPRC